MKKISTLIVCLALVFSFLCQISCKKAEVVLTYVLTVTVGAGVSGTPESNTYEYIIGDKVAYSYTLKADYKDLIVKLDSVSVPANGTITISGNQSLSVTATAVNPTYSVFISASEGVYAVPIAGTYPYKAGIKVNYSFALKEGYFGLLTKLDGVTVPDKGSFIVSTDHSLTASATKKYNILGDWSLSEKYDDSSVFLVTLKFKGDRNIGTVSDSDGGTGTYSVQGNTVSFNLIFPNVNYEYSGSLADDNTMSGTVKKRKSADTIVSGTWTAAKNNDQIGLNKKSTGKGKI